MIGDGHAVPLTHEQSELTSNQSRIAELIHEHVCGCDPDVVNDCAAPPAVTTAAATAILRRPSLLAEAAGLIDPTVALTAREVADMPRLTTDLAQFLWQLQPVTRGNCQAIVERLVQEARRETALKIADRIRASSGDYVQRTRDAAVALSFAEESSET